MGRTGVAPPQLRTSGCVDLKASVTALCTGALRAGTRIAVNPFETRDIG